MSDGSGGRFAEFLYRDGKTFYFNLDDEVYGFVPDCGLGLGEFEAVLDGASSDGRVLLEFLMRNTVMTSRPADFEPGGALTESFARLTERSPDAPETSRSFFAGWRLGYDRGYGDATNERAKRGAEG